MKCVCMMFILYFRETKEIKKTYIELLEIESKQLNVQFVINIDKRYLLINSNVVVPIQILRAVKKKTKYFKHRNYRTRGSIPLQ